MAGSMDRPAFEDHTPGVRRMCARGPTYIAGVSKTGYATATARSLQWACESPRVRAGTAAPYAQDPASRPGDRGYGECRVRRTAPAHDVRSEVHGRAVARLLRHGERCGAH